MSSERRFLQFHQVSYNVGRGLPPPAGLPTEADRFHAHHCHKALRISDGYGWSERCRCALRCSETRRDDIRQNDRRDTMSQSRRANTSDTSSTDSTRKNTTSTDSSREPRRIAFSV